MIERGSMVRGMALAAGLVMVAGVGATPSLAADDGYQNVFTSVLTAVGVLAPDPSPEIDYRERPPLVLPPKTALVKPQDPGVGRSAAWPADPDVARRRKEADATRIPLVNSFSRSADRPMSKEEMLKYRAAQAPQTAAYECKVGHGDNTSCRVDPDELKAESERYRMANPEKSPDLQAGVEPDRVYLTQPPKGYMKPTKVVKATTEAPEGKPSDSPIRSYTHPAASRIDPLAD